MFANINSPNKITFEMIARISKLTKLQSCDKLLIHDLETVNASWRNVIVLMMNAS